jgi:GTP-binding protein HflX
MVRSRIASLREDLAEVRQRRATGRKGRERVPLASAAIVGYTNAGKSTLLNKLTGADVLAANKLFATLDPTTRPLTLPNGMKVLLTDTVGFIRKLPHNLVEAFKATLEEAVLADFLILVADLSDPEMHAHIETTREVLRELGATNKPIITVYNKVDRVGTDFAREVGPQNCYVCAASGQGLEDLKGKLEALMLAQTQPVKLLIPHNRYDLLNFLHESGGVTSQKPTAKGMLVEARVTDKVFGYIQAHGA